MEKFTFYTESAIEDAILDMEGEFSLGKIDIDPTDADHETVMFYAVSKIKEALEFKQNPAIDAFIKRMSMRVGKLYEASNP